MRVVRDDCEANLARNEAPDLLGRRLRELAANVLRITRGAGNAHDLVLQMRELNEAIAMAPIVRTTQTAL